MRSPSAQRDLARAVRAGSDVPGRLSKRNGYETSPSERELLLVRNERVLRAQGVAPEVVARILAGPTGEKARPGRKPGWAAR